MADWQDPYAAAATNPYLQMMQPQQPDWRQVLSSALLGVGAGIGQADASGRGWGAGIGPGLLMGNQMLAQRQHHAEQEQMKRFQLGLMAQEYGDKHQDRILKRKQLDLAAKDYPDSPGLNVNASPTQLGPGTYDQRTASLEGGTKNGGMVFNELGSGAFGPYQFMPATYAGVRARNPGINLPEDMTKATREQWDQAHGALKAENAAGLKAAGIEPTPENLYLAHRFGVGGATAVNRADPNKMLAEILPVDWQKQNPDMRGQTAGGFRRLAAERMGGVGVPYEAPPNAKPTQYALMPDEMPLNIGSGITSLLPRSPLPSWIAPVMPQPQGPHVAQAGGVPVVPQGDAIAGQGDAPPRNAGPTAIEPPPRLVIPTQPILTPADNTRLRNMVYSEGPDKARAERQRILEMQQGQAKAEHAVVMDVWKQNQENRRFERGQEAGEWQLLDEKNARMMLGPGYENGKSYLRNKKGDIKQVGGAQTVVNLDMKGEGEFRKEMGKMDAKRFGDIIESERIMNDRAAKLGYAMDQFRQTYTGPGAEAANSLNRIFGAAGFDAAAKKANAADAGMAVIAEMKPAMRVAGSGTSTDKDMDVFGKALPGMMNLPGGNEKVAAYFQRMSDRTTRIRELAQEHSEGGTKMLVGTGFDKAVKELGGLFTPEELKEMNELGKVKIPAPPAGFTVTKPGVSSFGRDVPPPPAGFTVRP